MGLFWGRVWQRGLGLSIRRWKVHRRGEGRSDELEDQQLWLAGGKEGRGLSEGEEQSRGEVVMAGGRKNRVALAVLAVVVLGTGVGIMEIHREQKQERQNLHAGVIRDQQLLALKQKQQYEQQQQEQQQQLQPLIPTSSGSSQI